MKQIVTSIFAVTVMALGSRVFADKSSDTEACRDSHLALLNKSLPPQPSTYETAVFSSNILIFAGTGTRCEVWAGNVDKLIVYGQTLIEDGWPVGNQANYGILERKLAGERRELEAKISRIRTLQDNAESLLRTPGIVPKTVEDWVSCELLALESENDANCQQPQPQKPSPSGVADNTESSTDPSLQPQHVADAQKRIDQATADGKPVDFEDLLIVVRDGNIPIADREVLEREILSDVRPLPASNITRNLQGYQLLAALNPENEEYAAKVAHYSRQQKLANSPSVRDLSQQLSENRTRVQRDAYWATVDGKPVALEGWITNVRPAGLLLPATIEMRTAFSNTDISCGLTETAAQQIISLNVGDRIVCEGKLFNYTMLFGVLNVSTDSSNFERK